MDAPLDLSSLHLFFRQVSETATHACLLGGSTEINPLNQWVIMGLGLRQEIILQDETLQINGIKSSLAGSNASDILFESLEQARLSARVWQEEKAKFSLPMSGGLMGCLGYEFYRWCDDGWQGNCNPEKRKSATGWPDLMLCEFEDWLFLNLKNKELIVLSESPVREAEYRDCWRQVLALEPNRALEITLFDLEPEAINHYWDTFKPSFNKPDFENGVEALKRAIAQGNLYQANLSIQLQKTLSLDPYTLFEQLCRQNPSPFSGFFKWPDGIVVSNSPERLVCRDEQGKVQTRPIAGTRGRGKSDDEDDAIGQSLLGNEKEQAEHRMLVDLARNDLGRVCEVGSVQVDELLTLERYAHVTHLVSNVTGQLSPIQTSWALLRALFPGGTITGCPKIRCVEILDALEPVSRGFYTGGMGYWDAASHAMDLNILIRSLFMKPETPEAKSLPSDGADPLRYNVAVHVGAGIVQDAVGAHEYRECKRKASSALSALYLHDVDRRTESSPQLCPL